MIASIYVSIFVHSWQMTTNQIDCCTKKSVLHWLASEHDSILQVENIASILNDKVIAQYELMCNFVDNYDWVLSV